MDFENIFPFEIELMVFVGDLAQLPPICKHTI
jgi:hypothetical protein